MSDKPTSPIRSVAWKIAEEFKTLGEDVFENSIELDDQKGKWWEDKNVKPTYEVGVAAHVAENLIWWTFSPDEKDEARALLEEGGVEECLKKFPFHEAYLKYGTPKGLPGGYGNIKNLGDVISGTRNQDGKGAHPLQDKAFIVAYLEGLTAIYEDETRANRLRELAAPPHVYKERACGLKKLAQKAAEKAEAYRNAEMEHKDGTCDEAKVKCARNEWTSFQREAAEKVRCLLPLE